MVRHSHADACLPPRAGSGPSRPSERPDDLRWHGPAHDAKLPFWYTSEKVNFSDAWKNGHVTTPDGAEAPRRPFSPAPVMRPVDQVRLAIVQAIASDRLRPGDRLPSEHEQARGFH